METRQVDEDTSTIIRGRRWVTIAAKKKA